MVSLVVHELGHALGIGHAEPLVGTLDVMGYGTEEVPFPEAVISACDMDAFDVGLGVGDRRDGADPADGGPDRLRLTRPAIRSRNGRF